MRAVLIAVYFAILVAGALSDSTWTCDTFTTKAIGGEDSGITWWQGNCTGTTPAGSVGPIVVNTLKANLSNPNLILTTLIGNTSNGVETLPEMMKQDPTLLAGVNGGYFYRVDLKDFFDDVCFGKTHDEAVKPVSAVHPNQGIGDGLIVKNGRLIASNCNTSYGYNMPTTFIINGTNSRIVIQASGQPAPAGVTNALAAGPNLVSYGPTGPYVNVPAKDENVNKFEHSANTAVALIGTPGAFTDVVMVTFNGNDSCLFNPTCGVNSYQMSYFMKDYIGAAEAMNMDQGGSTTMVVKGEGNSDNLVSCSDVPNCEGGGRLLYSGFFIGLRS